VSISNDYRVWNPFTLIISGPKGSGKSSFCIKSLQNLDSVCSERDFDGGIIWCYSEKNAVPAQQLAGLRKKII
jgi:predicted ABC-type ATPase